MNRIAACLRATCVSATLLIGACASVAVPAPPAETQVTAPVPAGAGHVWVGKLMDGRQVALWGPRDSEAVFLVTCITPARIGFQHYGIADPAGLDSLRLDADGHAAEYPAVLATGDSGDSLLATTPASDPFLDRLLVASQLRVTADGTPLVIVPSAAVLRPVIDTCRD